MAETSLPLRSIAETTSELIYAPISVGQLLDQISILEIKAEKIKDVEKLLNVRKELSSLRRIATENGMGLDTEDYRELKWINEILWKTEDSLREKERETFLEQVGRSANR